MAEVGRFSQRISLEGLEEIKKGLEEIGLTGSKAFKEVDKAIAVANKELTGFAAVAAATQAAFAGFGTGLSRVGAATATLGSAFATLGSTVGALASRMAAFSGIGFALGVGGATAAIIAFIKASAEAGEEVLETSQSLGLSVEAYQRLGFAAQQSGINQEQFARGMSNLNKLIVDGANAQQKALLDFATSAKAGLGLAGQTVEDFRAKAGPTFQQITEAAKALQQQLEFRGVTGIPLGVLTENLRKLATGSAEARKQYVALTTGLGAPLVTTQLEKFAASVDTAGNALTRLGIRLVDPLTGQARNAEDVLDDLADALAKIPNETERAARVLEIFGARGGRKFIPFLAEGREGLQALKDEFSKFITGFDKPGAIAADKVTDAFSALFGTLKNVRNQLAVPLFGPLEAAAKAVQAVIFANRAAFEQLGQSIAARVIPIIRDFVTLITGGKLADDSGVKRLADGILAFGRVVSGAINNVIIPAFDILLGILTVVANAFNALFNTKITGGELGIGILVLAFTGLLGAISQVIVAVGALTLALVRMSAVPAFVAIATAITLFKDLNRTLDPAEKKMKEITEAFIKNKQALGEAEAVKRYEAAMRELASTQRDAGAATTEHFKKVAELTATILKGGPAAVQARRELEELTRSTAAVGTASQNSAIAVRQVGQAAATTGIQVREVGTATTQSTIAVQQAAVATQQATTQAATGLATVEAQADDVSIKTGEIGPAATLAMNPLEALGRVLFTGTLSEINTLIRALDDLARKAIETGRTVGSATGEFSGGGFIPGQARGGLIRGPGTATSDSILARLSSGEFVIRAAAVRHFGTEFFAALNALRTPRFNLGGLADGLNRTIARNFAVPGFAMGGPVDAQRGDLRPVIINIGGRQIAGLLAPPDVVKELRRAAISEQYLSAGRKTF